MTSRDFCYWLQGFFEVREASGGYSPGLNSAQEEMIRKHLAMVFIHEIDPSFGKDNDALNAAHFPPAEKPSPSKPPSSGSNTSGSGNPVIRC